MFIMSCVIDMSHVFNSVSVLIDLCGSDTDTVHWTMGVPV